MFNTSDGYNERLEVNKAIQQWTRYLPHFAPPGGCDENHDDYDHEDDCAWLILPVFERIKHVY